MRAFPPPPSPPPPPAAVSPPKAVYATATARQPSRLIRLRDDMRRRQLSSPAAAFDMLSTMPLYSFVSSLGERVTRTAAVFHAAVSLGGARINPC